MPRAGGRGRRRVLRLGVPRFGELRRTKPGVGDPGLTRIESVTGMRVRVGRPGRGLSGVGKPRHGRPRIGERGRGRPVSANPVWPGPANAAGSNPPGRLGSGSACSRRACREPARPVRPPLGAPRSGGTNPAGPGRLSSACPCRACREPRPGRLGPGSSRPAGTGPARRGPAADQTPGRRPGPGPRRPRRGCGSGAEIGGEGLRCRRRTGHGPGRLPLAQVLEPRVVDVVTEAARVRIVPARQARRAAARPASDRGRRTTGPRTPDPPEPTTAPARRPTGRPTPGPTVRVTLLVSVMPPGARATTGLLGLGPGFVIRSIGRRRFLRPSAAHEVSYP